MAGTDVQDPWAPTSEETPTALWLWLLGSVLGFVLGVLLQQYAEPADDYVNLLNACVIAATKASCKTALDQSHEGGHTFAHLNLLLALAETLKGLSIALLVSSLISNYFERHNRERLNAALSAKARQLSTNVFDAMFGNAHPSGVLETIKTMLARPILRDTLDVVYTLSRFDGPVGSRIAGQVFVRVDAVLSARTRNIANPATSSQPYKLPIALSLPNPLHDELKPHVGLTSFAINGHDLPPGVIDEANGKLRRALRNDSSADASVQLCEHPLSPGEDVRVQANYTMMKEMEDTEVLRSFQITNAISLTVIDSTGLGLEVRARAIHPSELSIAGSDRTFRRWELNDIVLPQQGIMVWWKKRLAPGTGKGEDGVVDESAG